MKKNKTVEMRIYELLGVKIFRKMAFGLRNLFFLPITIGMSKEERRRAFASLNNTSTNYNLGKGRRLDDAKKFKKQLLLNTGLHIYALGLCVPGFLNTISGVAPIGVSVSNAIAIAINFYCIMLQRYNWIRINQLIKRMAPIYEKQMEELKEELKEKDSLLPEHTYTIKNKRSKETELTFDQLIENANLNQLRACRKYLDDCNYYKILLRKGEEYYGSQSAAREIVGRNNTLTLKPGKRSCTE